MTHLSKHDVIYFLFRTRTRVRFSDNPRCAATRRGTLVDPSEYRAVPTARHPRRLGADVSAFSENLLVRRTTNEMPHDTRHRPQTPARCCCVVFDWVFSHDETRLPSSLTTACRARSNAPRERAHAHKPAHLPRAHDGRLLLHLLQPAVPSPTRPPSPCGRWTSSRRSPARTKRMSRPTRMTLLGAARGALSATTPDAERAGPARRVSLRPSLRRLSSATVLARPRSPPPTRALRHSHVLRVRTRREARDRGSSTRVHTHQI